MVVVSKTIIARIRVDLTRRSPTRPGPVQGQVLPGNEGILNPGEPLPDRPSPELVICRQNPLLPTATIPGLSLVVGTWH